MSVTANIVEGREQKSEKDFARFLGYALASTSELEYHLILARDFRAITDIEFRSTLEQLVDVRKMLHGLLAKLNKTQSAASGGAVASHSADGGKQRS